MLRRHRQSWMTPHLMNISPTLATLENGVVVCQYGRPGFHVAFSLDEGHTWQDRISFSHLPEPIITGQFDMIRVGPNEVVVIGSDDEGVKTWPIQVARRRVSPTHVELSGRVVDANGSAIVGALVERGPNRYTADDWLEDEEAKLDLWKSAPRLIGNPLLAYRSIEETEPHPIVRTDADGRVRCANVPLREYVLTVEAEGFAPQVRHVSVKPESGARDFTLKKGRRVRGRIVDENRAPVPGACVVLNRWHCHTDARGVYHWSVKAPLPDQVAVRVYRRYARRFGTLRATVPLGELESQPLTLKAAK